jgi:hypothetical protein
VTPSALRTGDPFVDKSQLIAAVERLGGIG